MSRTENHDVGLAGERYASQWRPEVGLLPDHVVDVFDGVLVRDVVTENGLLVASKGTPVEVKAAAYRKRDGRTQRRGDVHIRRHGHEALLERDGEYVVVVYDGDPLAPEWLAARMVSARTVDAHVTSWCRDGRDEVARLPWSRLMDSRRVAPGGDEE